MLRSLFVCTFTLSFAMSLRSSKDNFPKHLWRFEDPLDLGKDSARASWHNGTAWTPMNLTIPKGVASFSQDGVVGRYIGCDFNCSLGLQLGSGESLEFVYRSNSSGFLLTGPGRLHVGSSWSLDYPWNMGVMDISLTGTGMKGLNYASSGWHTIAISRNESGGVLFCLDGIFCYEKMNDLAFDTWSWELIPPIFLSYLPPNVFWMGIYVDEVAIYNGSLSKESMYQHYRNVIDEHEPYDFQVPGSDAPPVPEPSYPTQELNPLEFPPGTNLTIKGGGGNPTTGVNISAFDQLLQFPDPEYPASEDVMRRFERNFNWMDPGYMSGRGQPGVSPEEVLDREIALQELLFKKFHYGVVLSNLRSCCSEDFTRVVESAANYTDAVDVIILRLQTEGGTRLTDHNLPDGCYLQNARGQFLNGARGPEPVRKEEASLRPLSPASAVQVGCNASVWAHDGRSFNTSLNALQTILNKHAMKFDRINNDGEAINIQSAEVCLLDPVVAKDYNMSGAPDFLTYWSQWREYMSVPTFSDLFMDFRGNASGRYTQYQIQGTNPYFGNWSVTRNIMQPVNMKHKTGRDEDQFYSCADFYPRNPSTVYHSAGPWHGMDWMSKVRASEIRNGNPWFSPFVAAGWSGEVEMNIRPAQWLGILKIFGVWGAEFFYAGFFSTEKPFPNSENWIWQAAMPSYAQAITAHYADIFFNGTFAGFCETGYPNVFCAVRSSNTSNEYIIALTIQPMSNWMGNSAEVIENIKVVVPSVEQSGLSVEISNLTARRQGSVFRYNDARKSLDWLDEWHQDSHPIYWKSKEQFFS